MKALKYIAILLAAYVALVVAFESAIGFLQPQSEATLVITTTDASGATRQRVVSRLDSAGQMYVAANHWPRAWYNEVLQHPDVQVTQAGTTAAYRAVPVTEQEYERVNTEHALGLGIRILTGFPPRRFVRLDPLGAT